MRYLIAGDIAASRNSVSSRTFIRDYRNKVLFIKEDNEEKHLFFEPCFYDILMHIIPSKEINIMAKKNDKQHENTDKFDKIKRLGELKEKGYIDEEEFTKLKKEMI